MFDELFGEKAKASAAVDAYLERLERVLKVKKMALETSENHISSEMKKMLESLVKLTAIQANDAIKAYNKKEKDNVS